MMRWASIEIEISPKRRNKLHQQARKVCMGEKVANLIKKKTIKVNLMHKYFIHVQSYIAWHIASDICFLIWNRSTEWKRVSYSIKALERPSGRKKETQTNRNFKEFWILIRLVVKSRQIRTDQVLCNQHTRRNQD